MATDQKKIREDMQQWSEAFNARDLDRIDRLADEIWAADSMLHDPSMPNFGRGPSAWKQFVRQIFQDSPDVRMSGADLVGEGDCLAVRIIFSSTDASTGKLMGFPVMCIGHYADDKIVEAWELVGPTAEVPA